MPAVTVSSVNTSTEELTATAHGLLTGDRFRLRNVGGALPAATPALAAATDYFAIRTGADTIKVSDTNAHALAGTGIVNLTGTGSGTTTVEYGLPFCIPTAVAAAGTQVKSANDNGTWNALVALYNLLVGLTQSVWSAVTIAVAVTFNALATFAAGATAAVNQHFTVSGTGRYKHGTRTIVVPVVAAQVSVAPLTQIKATVSGTGSGSNVLYAPFAIESGKRVTAIRARIQDSVTGPTKLQVRIFAMADGAETFGSALATSSPSSGSGTEQTIQATALTLDVAALTNYYAVIDTQTGSGACSVFRCEIDYIDP